MTAFARWAAHMLQRGYSPAPLDPVSGLPALKGWDALRFRPMAYGKIKWLSQQKPQLGLAVVGGFNGLVPIDVDTNDEAIAAAVKSVLGEPVVSRYGSKGFLGFYWDPTGIIASDGYQGPRNFYPRPPERSPIVEVKARGCAVIPPSPHRKTGQPYRWLTKRTLFNTRVTELSIMTPEQLKQLEQALAPWCPIKPVYMPKPRPVDATPINDKRMLAYAEAALRRNVAKLSSLSGGRNWGLFRAACALGRYQHHEVLPEGMIEAGLVAASARNGYVKKAGIGQVLRTIRSGLEDALNDSLPVLEDRPRVGV